MYKPAGARASVPGEGNFGVADDRRAVGTVDPRHGEKRFAVRIAFARLFEGKLQSFIGLSAEFVDDIICHHERIVCKEIDRIQLELGRYVRERYVVRIARRIGVVVDGVAAEFSETEFVISAENRLFGRVHIVAGKHILSGFLGSRRNLSNAHCARQTVCKPHDHVGRFARLQIAEIVKALLRALYAFHSPRRFGREIDGLRAGFRAVLSCRRGFEHQHAVFIKIETPGIQRTFRGSGALPRFVRCVLRRIGEIVVVEVDGNVCGIGDGSDRFARFRLDLNRDIGGAGSGVNPPQPKRHTRRTAVIPAHVVYKVQADLPAAVRRSVQIELDREVVQSPACRAQRIVLNKARVCAGGYAERVAVRIDRRMQDQLIAFLQIVDLVRPTGRVDVERSGERIRRPPCRRSGSKRRTPSECHGEKNARHEHTCQNEDTLLFSHHFPYTSKRFLINGGKSPYNLKLK